MILPAPPGQESCPTCNGIGHVSREHEINVPEGAYCYAPIIDGETGTFFITKDWSAWMARKRWSWWDDNEETNGGTCHTAQECESEIRMLLEMKADAIDLAAELDRLRCVRRGPIRPEHRAGS